MTDETNPLNAGQDPTRLELQDWSAAALDHAWSWFTVHASQRMQLVNYWIVAVAFLTSALVTAMASGKPHIGFVVATAGAAGTFFFQRLDRRTRFLVQIGERALRQFERQLAAKSKVPELEILVAADSGPHFASYGSVILAMHWLVIGAFASTAAYSAHLWRAQSDPAPWVVSVVSTTPSVDPCDTVTKVRRSDRRGDVIRLQVSGRRDAARVAECLRASPGKMVSAPRRGRLP